MALSVAAVSISVSPFHVHDVRPQPLAGDLEGALRARRGLEEQVHLGAALQHRLALVGLAAQAHVAFGKVEEADGFEG